MIKAQKFYAGVLKIHNLQERFEVSESSLTSK